MPAVFHPRKVVLPVLPLLHLVLAQVETYVQYTLDMPESASFMPDVLCMLLTEYVLRGRDGDQRRCTAYRMVLSIYSQQLVGWTHQAL